MEKGWLFFKTGLAICLVLIVVFVSQRDWKPRDYLAWYAAGQIIRESPEQLYNARLQSSKQEAAGMKGGFFPFAYPPFVALGLALLAWLPVGWFYVALLILNLFLLGTTLWLIVRRFSLSYREAETLLLVAATAFSIYYNLIAGQLAFVSLLLITLFVAALLSKKPSAGYWVGALAFKPNLMIVPLGFLLLRRNWSAVWRALAVASSMAVLSVLLVGVDGVRAALWMMSQRGMHEVMRYMHNLRAVSSYAGTGTVGWVVLSGLVLLLLGAVVPFAQVDRSLISALLLATLLTSPQLHTYDLSILLVLLALGFPTGTWYQRLYVLLGLLPLLSIPVAFPVTPLVLLGLFGYCIKRTVEEIRARRGWPIRAGWGSKARSD